jgi:hypothetical protein
MIGSALQEINPYPTKACLMNEFNSPFRLSFPNSNPFAGQSIREKPVASLPGSQTRAVFPELAKQTGQSANPFLLSQSSPEFTSVYGKNLPLSEPMQIGHWKGKPVLGGSRLFLLY